VEGDIEDMNLIGKNMILEIILKHHDGIESERTAN
jgi:hypothetical protein